MTLSTAINKIMGPFISNFVDELDKTLVEK
jgi:hypothetical protein